MFAHFGRTLSPALLAFLSLAACHDASHRSPPRAPCVSRANKWVACRSQSTPASHGQPSAAAVAPATPSPVEAGVVGSPEPAAEPLTADAGDSAGEAVEREASAREWLGSDVPWTQWSRLSGTWGDLRTELEAGGFTLDASSIHDTSIVMRGGDGHPTANRGLVIVGTTFDLEPLVGWQGGTVYAELDSFSGQNGSDDVGDAQAYGNLDARDFRELYEAWFEQRLFDEQVRVKVGKVDANSEFDYVENGAEFVNSSMGFSQTCFVLPIYPDSAASVNLFVHPHEHCYGSVGVYDGATANDHATGTRGLRAFYEGPEDLFAIGEVGATWSIGSHEMPGRAAIGGWRHSATFARFDGGTEHGTSGLFALLDQTFWRENPEVADDLQGMGLFLQYGRADQDVSAIVYHVGGGVAWTGPLTSRDQDVLGLGASHVRFSSDSGAGFTESYELANELFYKLQLTPFFSLKPDLQYIVHPGGDAANEDTLVGTLRAELVF